jgi:hypothetical protein
VVPGQGVEGTVGQGDDRGLAPWFVPVGGQDGAECGDLLPCPGSSFDVTYSQVSEGAAAIGGRGVQCLRDRGACLGGVVDGAGQ